MCLVGISMMWQVGITVLDDETLHTIMVCHDNVLHKADMVLVHCQWHHYFPADEGLDSVSSLGVFRSSASLHHNCTMIAHSCAAFTHSCTKISLLDFINVYLNIWLFCSFQCATSS